MHDRLTLSGMATASHSNKKFPIQYWVNFFRKKKIKFWYTVTPFEVSNLRKRSTVSKKLVHYDLIGTIKRNSYEF